MASFTKADIDKMDKLYRINLLNSCTGYKSANLIATKSTEDVSNVAVFSSVTHMGSSPGIIGFFLRPTTVARHTYTNIKSTGLYTINTIHEAIIEQAHHTSAKYKASVSEFEMTDLEEEYKAHFLPPFVAQSPIKIAMQYIEDYKIKANNTLLVVGEILALYIDDTFLENDGFINLEKAKTATINGLDAYAIPKLKSRFAYQRPKL